LVKGEKGLKIFDLEYKKYVIKGEIVGGLGKSISSLVTKITY